jgi:hypothetical protein
VYYLQTHSFRTVVQHALFPTDSLTETTQIWGKEFPGRMFTMMPGNSYFFCFVYCHETRTSAPAIQPFPNIHPCIQFQE